MAERNAPIGIFDSGVGGLTVARAIVDQLPDESIIYIGDTANGPYGPQPINRVREHATRIADEVSYLYLYNPSVIQGWRPDLTGYEARRDGAVRFRTARLGEATEP